MKLVVISDTHAMHRRLDVPDGDVLIHCGDSLGYGTLIELEDLNNWFGTLPHKHKILISGNHDWCFQRNPKESHLALSNATYLKDSAIVIDGIKFYGTPWQPKFFNWAFNLPRGEALKEKWDMIPDDTDVLITHGPPYKVLDFTRQGESVGCEELLDAVLRVKPKVHAFGHVHNAYGQSKFHGIEFVNASICTEGYRPLNKPMEIVI